MEEHKRKYVWTNPSTTTSCSGPSSITSVFRVATTSTSTVNSIPRLDQYASLKHTESESTQETAAISDDELSIVEEEEEEATPEETKMPIPVSILRRKVKHGAIQPASGSAVTFCPKTVFPDPNEVPQKRKRVKRLPKAGKQSSKLHVQVIQSEYQSPFFCALRELLRASTL